MKIAVKLQKLYLKFLKKDEKSQYIVLLLENPIAYNQFFNLNFNLHHIILKYYRTYKLDMMQKKEFKGSFKKEGWIVLDKEVTPNEQMVDTVKVTYRILHEAIRKLKFDLNKNIQILHSKRQKIQIIELQKSFIESLIEEQCDLFTRTSLKQVNRTFNQEKKIAEISIIANPITIETIKDCFLLLLQHLKKYTTLNSGEWFGTLLSNDLKDQTKASITKQENIYIKESQEDLVTPIRFEQPTDDIDLSQDWIELEKLLTQINPQL